MLGALLLAACASQPPAYEQGLTAMAEGRYEEGVARLEQAARERPDDLKIRTDLINLREQALNTLLAGADSARAGRQFDAAGDGYRRVLKIEPGNDRARAGLAAIERDRRHVEILREAKEKRDQGDAEGAWERVQLVLRETPDDVEALELKRRIEEQRAREIASAPTLRSMYGGLVNLDFRNANLRMVLEALARTSGITFVFDKDVQQDLRTTIVGRQISFEDAVDLILTTNQLEEKIINRNTILIYPATEQKLRHYQDLVVKGFYLTYADVRQTENLLKTVLKPKDMFVDEKMNLIVLRDTPDAIRVAEKLVAMHDLAPPEVMMDVEVLEVQRNKLIQLGIQWPNQLTLAPLPSNGQTTTLKDVLHPTSGNTGATLASALLSLDKEGAIINLLANPRIRAQNHEKASVLIGDKVPVITTTTTATGFAAESVQYLDVGLKLEVEPSIRLQGEVEINLSLEVSTITKQVQTASGVLAYQLGTRNASTLLSLKDGETQVLAGLINDQDRHTSAGVPGLGDLPVLGKLFRNQTDDKERTEIVLLITPHLVRNITPPEAAASEFLSGTETMLRSPRLASPIVNTSAEVLAPSLGAAPPAEAAAGNTSLSWDGPQQAVKVGDRFQVALRIKADSPLRSVPLQLGFDPDALEVVDIAEGDFFKQGGAKSNFADNVDIADGRIAVGASRSGEAGASGEGKLLTVTFRAKAPQPQTAVRVVAVTAVGLAGNADVTVPAPFTMAVVP